MELAIRFLSTMTTCTWKPALYTATWNRIQPKRTQNVWAQVKKSIYYQHGGALTFTWQCVPGQCIWYCWVLTLYSDRPINKLPYFIRYWHVSSNQFELWVWKKKSTYGYTWVPLLDFRPLFFGDCLPLLVLSTFDVGCEFFLKKFAKAAGIFFSSFFGGFVSSECFPTEEKTHKISFINHLTSC